MCVYICSSTPRAGELSFAAVLRFSFAAVLSRSVLGRAKSFRVGCGRLREHNTRDPRTHCAGCWASRPRRGRHAQGLGRRVGTQSEEVDCVDAENAPWCVEACRRRLGSAVGERGRRRASSGHASRCGIGAGEAVGRSCLLADRGRPLCRTPTHRRTPRLDKRHHGFGRSGQNEQGQSTVARDDHNAGRR